MKVQELFADKFNPDFTKIVNDLYGDLYVYVDGKFLKGAEARIPVYDHGLLYGDGVFEGIRAYQGRLFKADEHLDRLYDSAKAIMLAVPLTKDEFRQVIEKLLELNSLQDAHIRPIVTRGSGRAGLDPRRSVRASVIVMALPMKPLLGEEPVRLITSTVRRKSPHAVDSKIKSLNYLDNILAKLQANNAGVDDALMLDLNGFVAEATGENLFVVRGSRVFTPETSAALHGITRETLMELARQQGYEVVEKNLTYQELYTADEIFLTGTAAEVVAVAEVDGRIIGDGQVGALTRRLMAAYRALHSPEDKE